MRTDSDQSASLERSSLRFTAHELRWRCSDLRRRQCRCLNTEMQAVVLAVGWVASAASDRGAERDHDVADDAAAGEEGQLYALGQPLPLLQPPITAWAAAVRGSSRLSRPLPRP